MSKTAQKWTEERTTTLENMVEGITLVSVDLVKSAAESLEVSTRSISSKLRNMGFDVESTVAASVAKYTEAEEAELKAFLEANNSVYTYAEVATSVFGGSRTAKQIQGKVLSMEMTEYVKATPKAEVVKKYTDDEETKLIGLIRAGNFIEDIASEMGREVKSIRGKILSLTRTDDTIEIPKQRDYVSKDTKDALTELGDVSEMTVEDIATAISKTERGVRTMLTHRGITCSNYDGAKKAEKIAEQKAAA